MSFFLQASIKLRFNRSSTRIRSPELYIACLSDAHGAQPDTYSITVLNRKRCRLSPRAGRPMAYHRAEPEKMSAVASRGSSHGLRGVDQVGEGAAEAVESAACSASSCRSSDWEPSAFETRAEPIRMCRKRPFAIHGRRHR